MVYGVFVSFYEDYFNNGLCEFERLLKSVAREYELVVIFNGSFSGQPADQMVSIKGSNSLWEFGGWNEGVATISIIKDDDYFIFANDTFCHHRPWSIVKRKLYSSFFRMHIKKNLMGITGDINSFNSSFSLLKYSGDSWISTYLFGVDASMMKLLNYDLAMDKKILDETVSIDTFGAIKYSDSVSPALAQHINRWMDPGNKNGWYKNTTSVENKAKKIKAILCEKYLSLRCRGLNGKLHSFHPGILATVIRKHDRLLTRYPRIIKIINRWFQK